MEATEEQRQKEDQERAKRTYASEMLLDRRGNDDIRSTRRLAILLAETRKVVVSHVEVERIEHLGGGRGGEDGVEAVRWSNTDGDQLNLPLSGRETQRRRKRETTSDAPPLPKQMPPNPRHHILRQRIFLLPLRQGLRIPTLAEELLALDSPENVDRCDAECDFVDGELTGVGEETDALCAVRRMLSISLGGGEATGERRDGK